jgi:1-acyl-sn-glycerol-3-phosphate acyltransferase
MTWLRSAAFNLWFYGVTVVVAVLSIPAPLFPESLTRWMARGWAHLVLGALGPLCGIRVQITGREHLPTGGPALIASQHQSAFDTIIWLLLVPSGAYVLKRELTRIPIYAAMCRTMGMIPVDRDAGASAIRSLLRGGDRAVAEGRQIVIFPEGTRAAPGTVLPLHPGVAALAARTGLPVVPVATDSGRCWGRRAFRKHPGVIHVAIRPPLPPGLPRAALLAQLSAIYAEDPAPPVDNSVGEGDADLSAVARKFP